MAHHKVGDSLSGNDKRRFTGPISPAPTGMPACINCGGPIGAGPVRRFCSSRCYRHAVFSGVIPVPICSICGEPRDPRMAWNREECRLVIMAEVRKRDHGLCWLCGRAVDHSLPRTDRWHETIDHFVPHVAGGESVIENLRLAHYFCNNEKSEAIPLPDGTLVPFVHPDLLLLHGQGVRPDHPLKITHWDRFIGER